MRPLDIGPVTIPGLMWGDIPVDPGHPIIPPSSSDVAPYELINNVGYRKQNRFGFNGSFGFEWNLDAITEGLSTKFMGSYDTRSLSTLTASHLMKNYAYVFVGDSVLFTNGTRSANQYMRIGKGSQSNYNINIQYMVNYNRVFGEKNKISAMSIKPIFA